MTVISNVRPEFYNTQIEEMPLNVAYVLGSNIFDM